MKLRTAILNLLLLAPAVWSEDIIRLKTRSVSPTPDSQPGHREGAHGAVRHFLVQFAAYPDAGVRAELARRHIQVLAYVPDNTLMVSGVAPNLRGLGVLWIGPLEAADKLSPALANASGGAYLLILQPDIEAAAGRSIVEQLGYTVWDNPRLLPSELLITGPSVALSALAAADEVAYILPASADLLSELPLQRCAGALSEAGPVAEYASSIAGWTRDLNGGVSLQYFFDSVTEKLDASAVRGEIARAFAEWARNANITFTAAGAAHNSRSIDVLFAYGAHGDAYPFDGAGGVLAHTFYPAPPNSEPIAGDLHLDAAENWKVGANVDLFSVALHEAGHALGLPHSDTPGDVMYPYYRIVSCLAPGDIAAIQAVYGKPASTTPPPPPPGTGTPTSPGSGTPPPSSDTIPPSVTIVAPGSTIVSTTGASITISGTARDNVAVASVKWTASTGGSGVASGTANWTILVPLLVGTNAITVRAFDAAGNTSWRAITVVRH